MAMGNMAFAVGNEEKGGFGGTLALTNVRETTNLFRLIVDCRRTQTNSFHQPFNVRKPAGTGRNLIL